MDALYTAFYWSVELMSKYSKKIESFLHDVDPSINLNNNANANANDNTSINNIYNSATQAIKTQYDIKIIKEQQLNLIHERDDYPLSYIFFKCL